MIFQQAVTFKDHKPAVWTPNAVYHLKLKADLAVPVISAETRANLARQEGTDEVSVSTIMVDGKDQFRMENVMLGRDVDKHSIIGAWIDFICQERGAGLTYVHPGRRTMAPCGVWSTF
jgi:hypothetical protein